MIKFWPLAEYLRRLPAFSLHSCRKIARVNLEANPGANTGLDYWRGLLLCTGLGVCLTGLPFQVSADLSGHDSGSPSSTRFVKNSVNRYASRSCSVPDAKTLSTIVALTTDRGNHASAVIIDSNRVLTAAHALRGSGHFFVRTGQSFHSADLIKIDHDLDLAVLAVDTGSLRPLPVMGSAPARSDYVWAVGFPGSLEMVLSRGTVESAGDGVLNTSATIDSGQSGGGLLSCRYGNWFLAGMLRGFGIYPEGNSYTKIENFSIAVAGVVISEFLGKRH